MTPLITLFFMLIVSISLTKVWNYSDIFLPIRNWMSDYKWLRKPWLCSICMSFWMGLISSFIIGDPLHQIGVISGLSNVMCGLISHLITSFLVEKEIL